MKRNPADLADRTFDVVVVGGGIYGACAAWEATLRGLSVALVERDDFGARTSSNSLKIAHGGLRYLQHADLPRMRQSIRERRTLMHVAPHLVHPLRCLLPAYGHGTRGREALAVAMRMTDLIGFDRSPPDPQKHLPGGRTYGRREAEALLPGVSTDGLTGAACWYDCQIYNPDRLVLAFIASAVARGAVAANYVAATDLILEGGKAKGIRATDALSGDAFEVRADAVINCAGPWVAELPALGGTPVTPPVAWSLAMNLVVPRLGPDFAFAAYAPTAFVDGEARPRKKPQALFLVPWRDVTLIGTMHRPYPGAPGDFRVTRRLVADFVGEVNGALPDLRLTPEDVRFWTGGLLPAAGAHRPDEDGVDLLNAYRVIDHGRGGADGLFSVVGVKFTTARHVAERVVDRVVRRGGAKAPPPGRSAVERLDGGDISDFNGFVAGAAAGDGAGLAPDALRALVMNHGTRYGEVLKLLPPADGAAGQNGGTDAMLLAAARYAVREEMAVSLTDVVRRRTEAGTAGLPDPATRSAIAQAVARELGWSERREAEELVALCSLYALAD